MTFDEAIDVDTFTEEDFEIDGAENAEITAIQEIGDEDGTTFEFTLSGMEDREGATPYLKPGSVRNALGNKVNSAGNLGTGNTNIQSGSQHACALKPDGTVWCWGYNNYGQLGIGHTSNRNTPQQVQNLSNVVQIDLGYNHSCALKADGKVWCWGYNGHGQLGQNNTSHYNTPRQVQNLSNVASIRLGIYRSCAMKADGTVWCWGDGWTL